MAEKRDIERQVRSSKPTGTVTSVDFLDQKQYRRNAIKELVERSKDVQRLFELYDEERKCGELAAEELMTEHRRDANVTKVSSTDGNLVAYVREASSEFRLGIQDIERVYDINPDAIKITQSKLIKDANGNPNKDGVLLLKELKDVKSNWVRTGEESAVVTTKDGFQKMIDEIEKIQRMIDEIQEE